MPVRDNTDRQTSRWVFTARSRPQFRTPPVPNALNSWISGQDRRNDADATFLDPHIVDCRCQHAAARCCCTPLLANAYHSIGGRLPEWQTSKCIYSVSFVRIESNFFTTHRRHRRKKDGPEFRNSNCYFLELFEFSKRRRAVPLRPIWTIMVAAN